jgi:acetylornithine deacetylase
MSQEAEALTRLAADLVAIDSRSAVSNLPLADRIEAELAGFEIGRLDYTDAQAVVKGVHAKHSLADLRCWSRLGTPSPVIRECRSSAG